MISTFPQRGFTLIELMVVMLVIAIVTGGALTSYFKFNESQVIANDARQLVGEISRVRALAASLQYPSGCTGFKGVNIKSDVAKTGVTVTSQCTSGNYSEVKTGLLKSSTFTQAFDITFLPGSGYSSTGSDVSIVISDYKAVPNTKTVSVANYGLISVQ